MKRLVLATLILSINGVLLLYYAYSWGSLVYLAFALLSLVLAYGVGTEKGTAIKAALIYSGIESFFALLTFTASPL